MTDFATDPFVVWMRFYIDRMSRSIAASRHTIAEIRSLLAESSPSQGTPTRPPFVQPRENAGSIREMILGHECFEDGLADGRINFHAETDTILCDHCGDIVVSEVFG